LSISNQKDQKDQKDRKTKRSSIIFKEPEEILEQKAESKIPQTRQHATPRSISFIDIKDSISQKTSRYRSKDTLHTQSQTPTQSSHHEEALTLRSTSRKNLLKSSLRPITPERILTLQILRGEKVEENANPYIKITVRNTKGVKMTFQTKAKLKKTDPVWTNESFQIQSPMFPIDCACLSSNYSPHTKSKVKEKDSPKLLGTFTITEEELKEDITTQIWFPLKVTHPHPSESRIQVELLLSNVKM